MTQEKYIGIENELTSFKDDAFDSEIIRQGFELGDFNKLLKDEYFTISDTSIRSNHGNGYYIDGDEIEIITPPIALNKGFSTRLTNALLLGRNYVIENTPHMLHTGYSMHWNLSHHYSNFDLSYDSDLLHNNLAIPFQLFGLTPLSCGSQVRTGKYKNRYEILGDSLTNTNQINATALLLGAYSAATETQSYHTDKFPIRVNGLGYNIQKPNLLQKGRYSEIEVKINDDFNDIKITQAQNILELFYEWLNPFVYKLGERDEINNLEAFITGEKKLEMDDVKYFNKLKKNNGLSDNGVYAPLVINTRYGSRSQILYPIKKDNLSVPIEGELLGIYAKNCNCHVGDKFVTTQMDWNCIRLLNSEMIGIIEPLRDIKSMYAFAQQYHDKEYIGSLETRNVIPNNILNNDENNIYSRLKNKIKYKSKKDLSV
jgi:hypothetical protein